MLTICSRSHCLVLLLPSTLVVPAISTHNLLETVCCEKKGKQSKDFNPIIMKNNSLILNLATDADEGYYMCQATNDIGSGLKKVIRVNVNGKFESVFTGLLLAMKFLNIKVPKKLYTLGVLFSSSIMRVTDSEIH